MEYPSTTVQYHTQICPLTVQYHTQICPLTVQYHTQICPLTVLLRSSPLWGALGPAPCRDGDRAPTCLPPMMVPLPTPAAFPLWASLIPALEGMSACHLHLILWYTTKEIIMSYREGIRGKASGVKH